MQHCCKFDAVDIYYLKDNNLYTSRKLSIGFCPICSKPIAELWEQNFLGVITKQYAVGIKADDLVRKYKDEIEYSLKEFNYRKFKSKPFGWKYGVNKAGKRNNKDVVKQYAYDFYANKELIKIVN